MAHPSFIRSTWAKFSWLLSSWGYQYIVGLFFYFSSNSFASDLELVYFIDWTICIWFVCIDNTFNVSNPSFGSPKKYVRSLTTLISLNLILAFASEEVVGNTTSCWVLNSLGVLLESTYLLQTHLVIVFLFQCSSLSHCTPNDSVFSNVLSYVHLISSVLRHTCALNLCSCVTGPPAWALVFRNLNTTFPFTQFLNNKCLFTNSHVDYPPGTHFFINTLNPLF